MPTHLLPRNSSAHRIAAIALYRALLTQCCAFTALEAQQRNALQNIVRNRFKQARYEQSEHRLKLNFEAGYEAIDYLDAAVAGEEESKSYIVDLLERAPEKIKQSPPTVVPKHLQKQLDKRRKAETRASELAKEKKRVSIFDRPLPLEKLSGRRRVPVLYSAQKIPVLRFSKPQPENLSGYLAHRVRVRQKRHDTRHRLEEELDLARTEDRWDALMAEELDESRWVQEPAWSAAPGLARRDVNERLAEEKRKNRDMAEVMQGMVDRERALYDEERAGRKEAKRLSWLDVLKEWKREQRERKAAGKVAPGVKNEKISEV